MKVEQSIQRVSNGPGGATRNVSAVAEYTLRNIRRLTFNQNMVKLLDFVLEWKNHYSVTVNVVVPLHN